MGFRCSNMLAAAAAATLATAAPAQEFSGAGFEINRDRVQTGTLGTCQKSTAFFVPDAYLYISARTQSKAGGGIMSAVARGRVFVTGFGKAEVQSLAANIQDQVIGQLRAVGYKVFTWDDAKADVADKPLMTVNPAAGFPTKSERNFAGIDFFVATPTDAQAIDFGMAGPHVNFSKAAARLGATLLLPVVYLTLPQIGASVSKTTGRAFNTSTAKITYDPSMHLAGITVYGLTAKGGWCSIIVPEHGVRLPAPVAGAFTELGSDDTRYADDWAAKRTDFSFAIDHAAVEVGVTAIARSLGKLVADSMQGKR